MRGFPVFILQSGCQISHQNRQVRKYTAEIVPQTSSKPPFRGVRIPDQMSQPVEAAAGFHGRKGRAKLKHKCLVCEHCVYFKVVRTDLCLFCWAFSDALSTPSLAASLLG